MTRFTGRDTRNLFAIASKSPFKAGNDISMYEFISGVILKPEINYISIKDENGGKK